MHACGAHAHSCPKSNQGRSGVGQQTEGQICFSSRYVSARKHTSEIQLRCKPPVLSNMMVERSCVGCLPWGGGQGSVCRASRPRLRLERHDGGTVVTRVGCTCHGVRWAAGFGVPCSPPSRRAGPACASRARLCAQLINANIHSSQGTSPVTSGPTICGRAVSGDTGMLRRSLRGSGGRGGRGDR